MLTSAAKLFRKHCQHVQENYSEYIADNFRNVALDFLTEVVMSSLLRDVKPGVVL
jgi:hypothetical protein